MIEVRNLHKSFYGKAVLENINACFYPGKTNLIIGASGSGKTVLIKCIVGLFTIEQGEILFDNNEFTSMSFEKKKELRKQIGMLFQGSALFDSMTVEENVMFPLQMFSDMSQEEIRDRVHFCLQRVNLPQASSLFPSELSGGMKKRVGIARAIAMNPKYLFCDEPNSGLDPRTSIVIDELIKEITYEYNITTIAVTHDMNSVMEIGDNVIFIHKGKQFWTGDKDSILHSDNEVLNNFVYASKFMRRYKELEN